MPILISVWLVIKTSVPWMVLCLGDLLVVVNSPLLLPFEVSSGPQIKYQEDGNRSGMPSRLQNHGVTLSSFLKKLYFFFHGMTEKVPM
jgi:hypothetical protein